MNARITFDKPSSVRHDARVMSTLLIVESPTKAKTIKKFLGKDYEVLSSFGHIRDLPKKNIGVDVDKNFEPTYVVPDDKKARVNDLKRAAKKADDIYLATDEDREGEAIAWHIAEELKLDVKKAKRIAFHEITKHAIEEALKEPRTLSMDLVDAQQTRRILDRLVGYELSPLLWKKVQRGLSAGRVQSVAMRLVVERERERQAFDQEEYWTIETLFHKDVAEFPGKLIQIGDKKLKKLDIKTKEESDKILDSLKDAEYKVASREQKHATRKPPTPLKTSTLQQEANNKLGFSAKQTMTLAQKLYETGRITYMRTDSLNLSEKFLGEAQEFIKSTFGPEYATGSATFKTKTKGAQEAHEAIRPTEPKTTPESLKGELESGQWKLYNLIWSRTMATQMPAAKLERTTLDIEAKQYTFRSNGSTIVFDGFMKIYKSAKETLLPELEKGDVVDLKTLEGKQHFTEPPARFSDATLVKELEEHGIGRPSTYAPTISTIISRGYVDRDDNKKLYPLDIAMIVNDMLVEHFKDIVDYDFTAILEKSLDEIAEGKIEWVPMLQAFYKPFHKNIEEKTDGLSRKDVMKEREIGKDPETGKMIFAKHGRFGPYLQVGEWSEEDREAKVNKPKMTSIPKDMSAETLKLEEALKLLELPRDVGTMEDGTVITAQIGPYGPYIKADKTNASLPEGYNPLTVTEEEAREIFKTDKARKEEMKKPIAELGEDPNSKKEILVKNGRFGPYITDGKTNVSLGKKLTPEEVTFDIAVEMLEKKRTSPKRSWGKKKKA